VSVVGIEINVRFGVVSGIKCDFPFFDLDCGGTVSGPVVTCFFFFGKQKKVGLGSRASDFAGSRRAGAVASTGPAPLADDAAVASTGLRQWPLDPVSWPVANEGRDDAVREPFAASLPPFSP